MHYALLGGTHAQPWQYHIRRYAQEHGIDCYQTTTPDIAPPLWQVVLEKYLFKYHRLNLATPLLVKQGTPPETLCLLDITGTPATTPHQSLLIKPFFNGSFDAQTLHTTITQGIAPNIGWAIRRTPDAPWHVIVEAEIAIKEPLSLQASLELCGERLQQLLERGMQKLSMGYTPSLPFTTLQHPPAAFSYGQLALKQLRYKLPRLLKKPFFRQNHWEMAITPRNATDPAAWQRLITPATHFEADPFLWEENDKTYLFYEQAVYQTGKGRIAYRVVADDGTMSDPVVVLEPPYHLSYPYLFRYNNTTYTPLT